MRDKIVFLRLGALGDLLVSLTALNDVLAAHPGKQIIVCGNALWLEILRAYPLWNIHTVYILNGKYGLDEYTRHDNWSKSGVSTTFYKLCRETQILYNLRHESLRYSWHAFFARVPVRFGSSPRFFKFLFTHWYGWLGMEPPIHERDWLAAIVSAPRRSSGIYRSQRYNRGLLEKRNAAHTYTELNREALPEMQLPKDAAAVLARYKLPPRKYILINPTASRRDKAWPAENFRALADFLAGQPGKAEIRMIGSPAETDWLTEAAGNAATLQPQNLRELFIIVTCAKALITNTSSMQFIASATQTPTLTLMGWADPIRWGPLGAQNLVIRGTTSHNRNIFARDEESYRSIAVERVEAESLTWLSGLSS